MDNKIDEIEKGNFSNSNNMEVEHNSTMKDEGVLKSKEVETKNSIPRNEIKENSEKMKKEENDMLNSNSQLGNVNSNMNYSPLTGEKRGKKRKFQKSDDQQCETCRMNDKSKLIQCYICKKTRCKNCAEKEPQYSSKKRDQSSYICQTCFQSEPLKIR
jgi:hypothetical protein